MSDRYGVTTQPGGYPPPMQGSPMYPPPGMAGDPGHPMYPPPGMPGAAGQPMYPGQPVVTQPMYPQPGMPGQPIAMQPMSGGPGPSPAGWMPAPPVPTNCPRGLEYLSQVDQLLVKQKVEMLEAFTGFETNNKYEVLNIMGQRVYYAVEDTCCATRNMCGSVRPFDIKILDNHKQEVMHLDRPLRCTNCLCFCCLQKMEVQAPPGTPVGYVRQAWSLCWPRYKLNNERDETVLLIKGPCCRLDICGDIEFDITSADEQTHVGRITKQWSGLAKEVFTDADNFGVSFPLDLDVKVKATALGAVFLIDFMYFEDGSSDNNRDFH